MKCFSANLQIFYCKFFFVAAVLFSQISFSQIPEFTISGNVDDIETRKPLVHASLLLVGSDGSSAQFYSDNSGKYFIRKTFVRSETRYKIACMISDYINQYFEFNTVGLLKSKKFIANFVLQFANMGDDFGFHPLALFDNSSDQLSDFWKERLNDIGAFMNENSTLLIEVCGFEDMAEFKKVDTLLAYKRAVNVKNYLVSLGIDGERLVPRGKGFEPYVVGRSDSNFKRNDVVDKKYIQHLKSKKLKEIANSYNRRVDGRVLAHNFGKEK